MRLLPNLVATAFALSACGRPVEPAKSPDPNERAADKVDRATDKAEKADEAADKAEKVQEDATH